MTELRPQISEDWIWHSTFAGCDGNNCDSRTLLVAIRRVGTTETDMTVEKQAWKLDNILCANGHQVISS
jgi:hypothetical protein